MTSATTRNYRTFTRRAKNWFDFVNARKHAVDRDLTIEEARQNCIRFNDSRTPKQIREGTKMEFESQ